ncbi:MAG: signal recognition particle-docking protein FtsY [Pseudomonadota bacterium]
MAFFKKLRDRMFRSSSKLDEGLDAIVHDGGTEDISRPATAEAERETPELAPPAGDVVPEPVSPRPSEVLEPEHTLAERAGRQEDAEPKAAPTAAPQQSRDHDSTGDARPGTAPDAATLPERKEPARPADTPVEEAARPGFFGRLLGRTGPGSEEPAVQAPNDKNGAPAAAPEPQGPVTRRALDDDMLESLEELLIASDMGVDTALRVAANLAEGRMGRRLSTAEIKALLSDEIARIMEPVAKPLPLYAKTPQVVLVVGVNGSGKTTTIGKLASQFRAAGKSVVIAAGDTFRAAAVEQLQVWGARAGVPVMTAPEGSDPASLAFDAMARAEAEGADLLMIDTAGRLQNRADLMEELAKIVRVIRKRDPDAPHNTLLVLDATTGQNALSQVETFQKLADVSGLVMTKLDGTARGGVLVALADKFGLPIHAIGVGEQIDDLAPFDPEDFARALTGVDG